MIEVVVAPEARADLDQIITTIAAAAGSATAGRWNDRFWATVDEIAAFPGPGPPRKRLGSGIRIKIVRPYIVIYEHAHGAEQAFVLRVVHGKRRITRKLVRSPG